MYNYILYKQIWWAGRYDAVQVQGTFDSIDAVNEFLITTGYPDNIKFISCRQIIETKIFDVQTRLDLTTISHNPIDTIGQLHNALEEEETILDLLQATVEAGDSLTSQDDKLVTVELRFLGGELFLKFSQCGISLLKDNTWKYEYEEES